jgi:hypothetical protein
LRSRAAPGFYPIGRAELYDLANDPREQHNLAAEQPAKVVELRGLITNASPVWPDHGSSRRSPRDCRTSSSPSATSPIDRNGRLDMAKPRG